MTLSISRSRSVCVGDVAADRVGTRDLLGERREPIGATRGEDGNPAGLADCPRELGAEPGARPCDDDDTTVEQLHPDPLS